MQRYVTPIRAARYVEENLPLKFIDPLPETALNVMEQAISVLWDAASQDDLATSDERLAVHQHAIALLDYVERLKCWRE